MRQEQKCPWDDILIFEGYYLRQKDTVSSPQHVNAVGQPCNCIFLEAVALGTR